MPNWKKLILSGSDAELNSLNVTSTFTASGLNYPSSDGTDGQVIMTDGSGILTFNDVSVYAQVKNITGGTLAKGTPVHASGSAGNTSEVIAASASVAATMPATFVLAEELADEEEGRAIVVGYINGVNTSLFNEGDVVYVGAEGGYTNVKPTGSNLIQNLGIVTKAAVNGSGFIYGAGRSNDVPNITSGYAWVGNNDQVATAVATSSFVVTNANTASYVAGGNVDGDVASATDATNSTNVNVGNSDDSSTYYILGALGTGNQALKRDSGITFNSSTNTLNVGGLDTSGKIFIGANDIELRGDANNLIVYDGGLYTEGAITASGAISASSYTGDGSNLTGVGTVDTSGTPANNQIAVFTDSDTIEGDSDLTWDSTTLDVNGMVDIDFNTTNTNTAVVDISNNTSAIMSTNHYTLKVAGGQANGAPSGQQKSYGGYFTAGNTNGAFPDSIALYAQGHEDGAPNSYAAIFSGSAGGVVGINTMEPTVELDVVGDISASGTITANSFTGTATNATNVNVSNSDDSSTYYILGALGTGNQALKRDNGITFNSSTNTLNAGNLDSAGKIFIGDNELRSFNNNFVVYDGGLYAEGAITASGDITGSDVYINNWGSVSASLASAGGGSANMVNSKTSPTTVGEFNDGARLLTDHSSQAITAGNLVSLTGVGASNVGAQSAAAAATGMLFMATDAGDSDELLIEGVVKLSSTTTTALMATNAKVGTPLYMSTTAGAVQTAAPSTAGDFVRVVGHVLNATDRVIYFNPSVDWIEL